MMATLIESWFDRRTRGSIEITELPPPETPSPVDRLIQRREVYTWHPPYQVAVQLPKDTNLSHECTTDLSGNRRFVPRKSTGSFLGWAGAIGHLLLDDRDGCKGGLLDYHELRLLRQYTSHLREHIGSTRALHAALRIPRIARIGNQLEDRDILPDDIGLNNNRRGERWSLTRLMEEGRKSERSVGNIHISEERAFSHGLYCAAQLAPLEATPNEVASLVRMAFFALRPGNDATNEEVLKFVAKEFKRAVREHLYDSTEEFNAWIVDKKSDLVRRIAKRKKCQTDREGVRAALLELGAQALWRHGECIDAAMRAFCEAMPKPLEGYESDWFTNLYFCQPHFGNLPLVLLRDRFELLKPAIFAIWNNPADERHRRVLYRLLNWFQQIMEKRRGADRRLKSQRGSNGRAIASVPHVDQTTSMPTSGGSLPRDVVQRLAFERLNIDLDLEEWDSEEQQLSENTVQIVIYRARSEDAQEFVATMKQIARARETVLA